MFSNSHACSQARQGLRSDHRRMQAHRRSKLASRPVLPAAQHPAQPRRYSLDQHSTAKPRSNMRHVRATLVTGSRHLRAHCCATQLTQLCHCAGQHRRRHQDTPRLYTFQQVIWRNIDDAC